MKPLLILMRIAFVGVFWSILFLEGIRVIMLTNWHFDIVRPAHWMYAWNLWLSGWVIDEPKEWAFVLIILTFIPVWLTGWTALSMLRWEKAFAFSLSLPLNIIKYLFAKQVNKLTSSASVKVVKKKKSYKEIRPRSIRPPLEDSAYALPADKKAALSGISTKAKIHAQPTVTAAQPTEPKEFNHSLFQFDDSDSAAFDFDLFDDKPSENPPAPAPKTSQPAPNQKSNKDSGKNKNKNNTNNNNQQRNSPPQTNNRSGSNSTLETLRQKGWEVITGATIKNTLVDFIGVSADKICLCLNDKEPGDWLADEERFNDEEPLWFSESSHRISPVRKLDIARLILSDKLTEADLSFKIDAYVIEQIGNIINAEDMFDIWESMNINVTRIDRGTPKEIKLFTKTLDEADTAIDKDSFEKIKKLIRSIA